MALGNQEGHTAPHLQSIKRSLKLDLILITGVHVRILNFFGHIVSFENLMTSSYRFSHKKTSLLQMHIKLSIQFNGTPDAKNSILSHHKSKTHSKPGKAEIATWQKEVELRAKSPEF